ncbi:hypothetical protein SAMN05421741_10874 [Paenimyroides ummariense]|uniref:Uncharacterized protein n=1 Tax=Paenimyroides ummariense TaxID=913024 RepID=A0A1I5AJS3_9FLAO|nr:hypothetical protein SAMN05421741_10874 [Paenimyroides ummariense]
MLKKILLYTLIYIVISFLMSYNEIQCALNGEELCWYNLIGKFIIFILLIMLFDQFIKPKIFKR